MLIGGDFNVTLKPRHRPNYNEGQDLDSKEFWGFTSHGVLQEMWPMNWLYRWRRTAGCNMPSKLDRGLWSMEVAQFFPLADVHSLVTSVKSHPNCVNEQGTGKVQASPGK